MIGTRLVTWAWVVNRIREERPVSPSRPLARLLVTSAGSASTATCGPAPTFMTVFGPTLTQFRAFACQLVLITETGVPPGPRQAARITRLFAAAHAAGLAGLIWFDANARQRWWIDGDPSALAAYRRAARSRK
jgi:mannan endo-1,4-beta-mannosidase